MQTYLWQEFGYGDCLARSMSRYRPHLLSVGGCFIILAVAW